VPAVVSFKPDLQVAHDFYALADPVHGVKVGAHHAGAEIDPNGTGEPDPHLIDRITTWARGAYRLADPDPVGAETCVYTTTPDESFVLERRGRVVVGSACSGHGFKFAPAVGTRLADLALQGIG
jgi:sarcosine oxidase